MALSSVQNNDPLKSNRFSMFVHSTNEEKSNRHDFFESENSRKIKLTPRKCKTNFNVSHEATMKKSSSLHNIEKVGELIENNKEITGNNSMSILRGVSSLDKQKLYSKIEKEKKYEDQISELSLKKEKEILLMENKRLTETVQNLQMDADKMRVVISVLKVKMHELGQEFDDEEVIISEVMDASGDGGTGRSFVSLTQATVGDTDSVSSDEWHGTEEVGEPDRDFLRSLSVSTLQDRIQKMEEDSYCTEEELQATMQELNDLRHNLDVINDDNRNLSFERGILLESLCEQTQKLQQCRLLCENLKVLLLTNISRDYPHLDAKLREAYTISEEDNRALIEHNEELKITLMNCQSEKLQLSYEHDSLVQKLNVEQAKYSKLDEKYRDELWQREQVETALKTHNDLFGKNVNWTDCSNGVLTIIQQCKGHKQMESNLRTELTERNGTIDCLLVQIRNLEESMRQGMKYKEENKDSIEHLRSQLEESEREIAILSQTVNSLTEKCADETIMWRLHELDLLTSIVAANSLKEDRDKDLIEMEKRLEQSELERKQLQEKLDSQKSCITSQTKDRVINTHDQNSISNTNSVKTLIQSLEDQMKPGVVGMKQSQTVARTSNIVCSTNTVPRASVAVKSAKKEITRMNTVKTDVSPSKHIPEITIQKSSSFKTDIPQKLPAPSTESSLTMLQPLTAVVSQASSILQSVSRRNSVVTNPILEHHHSHYNQSPATSKPPSPPPTSSDPLAQLVKKTNKGSKRNALLYWCQTRTNGYSKIDITNFSSSWNDGLALCALIHSFDPSLVDFKRLADATSPNPDKFQKRMNFQAAFSAAENLGIPSILDIETMINVERPAWNSVMNYVVEIYIHCDCPQSEWAPPLNNLCHM